MYILLRCLNLVLEYTLQHKSSKSHGSFSVHTHPVGSDVSTDLQTVQKSKNMQLRQHKSSASEDFTATYLE